MRKISFLAFLFLVLNQLIIPTFGGIPWIVTVDTSSCNGVSFSWSGTETGSVRIRLVNITLTPAVQLADLNFSYPDPISNSSSFTFDPPLPDGTLVNILGSLETAPGPPTPDYEYDTTFQIRCTQNDTADENKPYLELCDDGRINTNLCEPIAIYPIETDDGIGITVWDARRTGSRGQLVYVAAEEVAALPQHNCTLGISDDGFATVFLFGGDIVVVAGPDDENKTFVFYFEEFPDIPETDTLVGGVSLNLPPCLE